MFQHSLTIECGEQRIFSISQNNSLLSGFRHLNNAGTFCSLMERKPTVSKHSFKTFARIITHFISRFTHYIVFLATGPYTLSKGFLHWVQSSARAFKFQHLPFSLEISSSCLCHLLCLSASCILSSIQYFSRQLLRKMLPIQLVFLRFIVCRIFLSFFIFIR